MKGIEDGLSALLFDIVLDMVIKKVNFNTEVFTNHGTEMVLTFADHMDTVGKNTTGITESFLQIERATCV